MKAAYILLLCTISNLCISQITYLPAGRYVSSPGYQYSSFDIDSLGEFTCTFSGCMGTSFGRGKAMVYNHQLFIHFADSVYNEVDLVCRTSPENNDTASILIFLNFYAEETGAPLDLLQVEVEHEIQNFKYLEKTDHNGFLSLRLPQVSGVYNCYIRQNPLHSFKLTFSAEESLNAEVFLPLGTLSPLNSMNSFYLNICEMSENQIVLQYPKYIYTIVWNRVVK